MVATRLDWDALLAGGPDEDAVRRLCETAEHRRVSADYDTGSIAEIEARLLWALADALQAKTILEVGTFIGTSTCALASAPSVERVYTCDASNDCLPRTEKIQTFPKQSSIAMLKHLVKQRVAVDLCFFDGVLTHDDVDLLTRICHARTVFTAHDYNYGPKIRKHGLETMPRKGIGNMRLLSPVWPAHRLIEPFPETTLAALVPETWR